MMSATEKDSNATFVRPEKFYISGFSNVPHAKYFYIFLCFVYMMTVVGNVVLLSVICLVKSLHSPKYMIVFNLAFTDLCGSTALIPKLMDTFLFDRRYILYEHCLSHMFFVLFFGSMQSWTLVTMAYDRLVAICFPLRYRSVVTAAAVAAMLLFSWVFLASFATSAVVSLTRLSFCGSLVINSFYCDHGPVFRLACNDTTLNITNAYIALVAVIFCPLILIVVTYICIGVALSRIASGEERVRAVKTCTSHLILVAIFFGPVLFTNVLGASAPVHPNTRIINSTLTNTMPSLLNPIIYSLKTEEVLISLKMLYKRNMLRNKVSSKKIKSSSFPHGLRNKSH